MKARSSLVGRADELERLTARLDLARRGEGGIVLVSGEAGVGKTRLAAELARRSTDALMLSGAASPTGSAPYAPLVAALRAHLRSNSDALSGVGRLRRT
jgi:predicted ATPase